MTNTASVRYFNIHVSFAQVQPMLKVHPVGVGVVDSRYLSLADFQKCCGVVSKGCCDVA